MVDLVEVRDHAFLDVLSAFAETSSNVFNDSSSHVIIEDSTEEFSGLLVVVVRVIMFVTTDSSRVGSSVPGVGLVSFRTVKGVGTVVWLASLVSLIGESVALLV